MKTAGHGCAFAFAAAALIGCGGAGAAANGPAGAGPSRLEFKFADSQQKSVAGPAFASVVTIEKNAFGPQKTRLMVYVFAGNTVPAPSCEMLARAGALADLTRGGFLAFTVDKVPDGPGKVDVSELGALFGDADTHSMFMAGKEATGMTLTLKTYDAKFVAGDVTTAAGGETRASGTIAGAVCPPSTVPDPNAGASPSAGGSGDEPPGGLTNDTSSMPPPPEPAPPPPPPPDAKPKTKPKGKPAATK